METNNKRWLISGIVIGSVLFIALMVRVTFFNFIDADEFGYSFNTRTGELKPLLNENGELIQGYVFSYPIVMKIHTIGLKPMQVCINANSRVLNCKLVRFNPDGFKTLISYHGRGDYSEDYRLPEILKSYAYDPSNQDYPFLIIEKELKNESVDYKYDIKIDSLKYK